MTTGRYCRKAVGSFCRHGFSKAVSVAFCLLSIVPLPAGAQDAAQTTAQTADEIIEEALEGTNALEEDFRRPKNNYCQIILGGEGVLREVPGLLELSSKSAGGRPGSAQIMTSNASFRVSIDAPLGFHTSPRDGNNGVVMAASYSGNGASNFSETPGDIQHKLKKGITNIEAHLVAHRNGEPFPAGNYAAVLTLRCE